MKILLKVLFLTLLWSCSHGYDKGNFYIKNNQFYKNDKPCKLLGGSIHYSRVLPELWRDRLLRMRALGLNTIQTLIPWNWHQSAQGSFDWDSPSRNLPRFLRLAQELDLNVIVRIGPYICAEWEFGGLPAWLLQNGSIALRTFSEPFISHVIEYWANEDKGLLHILKPFLIQNGGPIIMVQIENEFGSYGDVSSVPNDRKYLLFLITLAKKYLGREVLFFTTDGASYHYISRGTLRGGVIYSATDGVSAQRSLELETEWNEAGGGPLLTTELYVGWLTHWGEKIQNHTTLQDENVIKSFLEMNGSFTLYMAHGGSNFGFWNGANGNGKSYSPVITSYDYNAPISESGAHGYGFDGIDKFEVIKRELSKYVANKYFEPEASIAKNYGEVQLKSTLDVLKNVDKLCSKFTRANITSPMEQNGCFYGFILYNTKFSSLQQNGSFSIPEVRDCAQVFVDDASIGVISRNSNNKLLNIGRPWSSLKILVENQGRIGYSKAMEQETKGIISGVYINNQKLNATWNSYCLDFSNPLDFNMLPFRSLKVEQQVQSMPQLFKGTLDLRTEDALYDTFLLLNGWHKGVAWVNGFTLGRYWADKGPQQTLYVPRPLLRKGENTVVLLELYPSEKDKRRVSFVESHIWDRTRNYKDKSWELEEELERF